jgi:hypothetical protein
MSTQNVIILLHVIAVDGRLTGAAHFPKHFLLISCVLKKAGPSGPASESLE